mmetsp:Transcript_2277/g.3739  ORF Transcript_2277/g.3739 Transcript_2277/m.3739 type:complete len:121 (+) Transcript_2277:826-1188(+)
MDAVNAAAKSVGRINPSHMTLKQSSNWFLLSAFVEESPVLCVLLLGVGTSGDVKDAGDLIEREAGWMNASESAIDDDTSATATQAFLVFGRGFIVLAVWRALADFVPSNYNWSRSQFAWK